MEIFLMMSFLEARDEKREPSFCYSFVKEIFLMMVFLEARVEKREAREAL